MKNYKNGFTLAEVLITLVIIGVVASLTIPTAIAKYRKTQTAIKLKKVYSVLAQTTARAVADNGSVQMWDVVTNQSSQFANKYLLPYLSIMKNCGNSTTGSCEFEYYDLNGQNRQVFGSNWSRFYLNDGTMVAVVLINQNSIASTGCTCDSYSKVFVDINGQKKPNVWGKDVFDFWYHICRCTPNNEKNGKFLPDGINGSRNGLLNACKTTYRTGELCTALIMHDGWHIKDDYPW